MRVLYRRSCFCAGASSRAVVWADCPSLATARRQHPWGHCRVRPWPLIGMSELLDRACFWISANTIRQPQPELHPPLVTLPSGISRKCRFVKCRGVTNPAHHGQEQPVGKTKGCPSPSPYVWTARAQRWISMEVGAVLLLRWAQSPDRSFLEQDCKFKLRWEHEIIVLQHLFGECRHQLTSTWLVLILLLSFPLPFSFCLFLFLIPLLPFSYIFFLFPCRSNQVFSTSMWVTKLETDRKQTAFYLMAMGSSAGNTKVRKLW